MNINLLVPFVPEFITSDSDTVLLKVNGIPRGKLRIGETYGT